MASTPGVHDPATDTYLGTTCDVMDFSPQFFGFDPLGAVQKWWNRMVPHVYPVTFKSTHFSSHLSHLKSSQAMVEAAIANDIQLLCINDDSLPEGFAGEDRFVVFNDQGTLVTLDYRPFYVITNGAPYINVGTVFDPSLGQ